jgi:hypothetical protein
MRLEYPNFVFKVLEVLLQANANKGLRVGLKLVVYQDSGVYPVYRIGIFIEKKSSYQRNEYGDSKEVPIFYKL